MNSVALGSASFSTDDMSDLDGYSVEGDYSYSLHNGQYPSSSTDDFGFDPPGRNNTYPKLEPTSPIDQMESLQHSSWAFDGAGPKDHSHNDKFARHGANSQSFEIDRMIGQSLPHSSAAIARFGNLTPPRSDSATSEEMVQDDATQSPRTMAQERRRRNSKATPPEDSAEVIKSSTVRKRKSTRKASAAVLDEQDDKRRQSLEKNRLAAAKCRVNKKEKTEQLQRDSHDKAVHNAFLKDQIMRMKEEVQQMNALLLSHANCEGCKSPEEIQKHLSNLGNEFFAHHMASLDYGDFSHMSHQEGSHYNQNSSLHTNYFAEADLTGSHMNPPLPAFDRDADFECHTPMHTD